ncbi:PREDICTED: probable methyltransferase PMT11 [Nicotiana attenuata]|uniref:Methyltransferase n=1 Tax=Nicotiana attenuata TaxID=49451 RepID=A0A314L9X8_NICAT|nr:PREDICTED: probable methyltransferase PMT11 [Nicotiana attenuata]OIT38581.1 putative methyltransferase pmt11 [Nicotiana attenuata]
MKGLSGDLLRSTTVIKVLAFVFLAVAFFYFGKHWSDGSSQQPLFFDSRQNSSGPISSSAVSLSSNFNKTFDLSTVINDTNKQQAGEVSIPPPPAVTLSPPPPPPAVQHMGLLDENGVMKEDFAVGDYDPDVVENWPGVGNETDLSENNKVVKVKKFGLCPESMREYIPCLDNVEAIKKLNSTEKGEKFERHCPEKDKRLNCLVPAPRGYQTPIPWPRSRDEVWFSNVPHARLVEDKGGQNWITIDKDKFKFPGGGTQFIHGADQYLDQIEKMVPEIAFGRHTRVALDIGCGVASFGAYLLSRNVLTLSIAPKDVHENQIQFALERGVPAMVAAFATHRLMYPSQAFELIHCSRCRINWTRDDGILLLEVNRILRAGGYFVWAAQPVYKHEAALEEQWEEMVNLTTRLCWKLVKKEGYIAIWQKPLNNSCYLSREEGTQPPLCDPQDDPDNVWYVDLKACITGLPEEGYGANITTWPSRLHDPPERLQSIQLDAYISRKELFRAESRFWKEIIESYVRALHWKNFKLRNVLDMRAGFGGFAAALIENQLDCWVLNVVPVSGRNTLPIIYDRGLLGVMHDWCEPFDTYPRTYDLLHAHGLFSIERKRCNISTIMLEMDRLLRPGGRIYIRDSLAVMDELQEVGKAMGWHVSLRDTSEGPHASYRILTCDKRLLRA